MIIYLDLRLCETSSLEALQKFIWITVFILLVIGIGKWRICGCSTWTIWHQNILLVGWVLSFHYDLKENVSTKENFWDTHPSSPVSNWPSRLRNYIVCKRFAVQTFRINGFCYLYESSAQHHLNLNRTYTQKYKNVQMQFLSTRFSDCVAIDSMPIKIQNVLNCFPKITVFQKRGISQGR